MTACSLLMVYRPGGLPITDTYPTRPARVSRPARKASREPQLQTHDVRRAMAVPDDRERQHVDAARRTLPVLSMAAETTLALGASMLAGLPLPT